MVGAKPKDRNERPSELIMWWVYMFAVFRNMKLFKNKTSGGTECDLIVQGSVWLCRTCQPAVWCDLFFMSGSTNAYVYTLNMNLDTLDKTHSSVLCWIAAKFFASDTCIQGPVCMFQINIPTFQPNRPNVRGLGLKRCLKCIPTQVFCCPGETIFHVRFHPWKPWVIITWLW